ncbi:MAG: hypothetical protein FWF94_04310 [Oscillospiraceae bacterium]|nr:hypothetical protein [Oscillospiraceae bacterium]
MEVIQYKCPNCGADLVFRADSQSFMCAYCESAFSSEQIAEIFPQKEEHKLDIEEPTKTADELELEKEFGEFNALYNCPSCGASVITDANTSATQCVFCLSPVILTGRLSGEHKPSKLIPFKITKEKAAEMFKEYCRKRWFLPSGFRSGAHLHEMTAIYVPYWISDCSTAGTITANCKKIRSWTSGNYRYTETKEYIAVRDGGMKFDGIPHDASSRIDDVMMECIEPFNYKETTDFKMSYLSGFIAEKYDVTKEQVEPRITKRAINSATETMRATITGYSAVNVTSNSIALNGNKWSHFLLPVWFLTYKHNDKFYHFAVNGQTGKFAGNLPVIKAKVALAAGITAVIANLIIGGIIHYV